MISRRSFTVGLLAAAAASRVFGYPTAFKGEDVFDRMLKEADPAKWRELPIGECMKRIAMGFESFLKPGSRASPQRLPGNPDRASSQYPIDCF